MPPLHKRSGKRASNAKGPGAESQDDDADEGIAAGLKATLDTNLKDMLNNCHKPSELLVLLRKNITKGDFLACHFMCYGWKDALQSRRDSCVNAGVICALMASMTVPLALDWPSLERWGVDRQEGDDHWSDERELCRHLYMIFMASSAYVSIAGVIIAAIWVQYSQVFVQDAEDALWYCATIPFTLPDAFLFLTVVSCGAGMTCGYIGVNTGPASDAVFIIGCTISCGTLFFWMLCLGTVQHRRFRTIHTLKSTLLEIIPDPNRPALLGTAAAAVVSGTVVEPESATGA